MNKLNKLIAFVNSHYFTIALTLVCVILFDEWPPIK